jgi:hypothetical protein
MSVADRPQAANQGTALAQTSSGGLSAESARSLEGAAANDRLAGSTERLAPESSWARQTPRSLLWEAMLDADYLTRYYAELGLEHERNETLLHFATLFLSAGTVVTLLDRVQAISPAVGPWIVQGLALGTVAASLWMALKRYGRSASLASYLSSRYSHAQWEYERLWAQMDELKPEAVLRGMEEIGSRIEEWDHIARREMPRDRKLSEKCFDEMLAGRSLQVAAA